MGKKAAHTGMSPKDISANAMDKFISRNDRKRQIEFQRLGRYKHEEKPVDLWPLQDQIEWFEENKERVKFDYHYPSYAAWRTEVMDRTGVYPSTFITFTAPHRETMKTMFAKRTSTREAADRLRALGIY